MSLIGVIQRAGAGGGNRIPAFPPRPDAVQKQPAYLGVGLPPSVTRFISLTILRRISSFAARKDL
jgi:hypothetical protein